MLNHVATMALGLALVACGGDGRRHRFEDTTGARFELSCSETGCDVTQLDPGACGHEVGLGGSRFLTVNTFEGGLGFVENERIVACESDDDCKQSHNFAATYECRVGLCEDPDWPEDQITLNDVMALCLADVSRDDYCRRSLFGMQEEPRAVRLAREACPISAVSLGDSCTEVPAECVDR